VKFASEGTDPLFLNVNFVSSLNWQLILYQMFVIYLMIYLLGNKLVFWLNWCAFLSNRTSCALTLTLRTKPLPFLMLQAFVDFERQDNENFTKQRLCRSFLSLLR
jgi:hypothetical protein